MVHGSCSHIYIYIGVLYLIFSRLLYFPLEVLAKYIYAYNMLRSISQLYFRAALEVVYMPICMEWSSGHNVEELNV